MTASRNARIAEEIQRSLADVIRLELRDPRVGMVTLTGVELSRDQSHAKVFFTVLGAESAARDVGSIKARPEKWQDMFFPELHFEHDESVERGVRLSRLIDEAVKPAPAGARRPRRGPGR